MIQHLRYMADLRRIQLFNASEDKIVILSAVVLTPEASGLDRNRGLNGKQMADIVIAAQQIYIKIRLLMVVKIPCTRRIYLILIGIYGLIPVPVYIAVTDKPLIQHIHYLIKGIRRQDVIMIEHSHIITARHNKSTVRIARYAPVCVKPLILYLIRGVLIKRFLIFLNTVLNGIILTAVRNAKLPVIIGLLNDRSHHLLKQLRVRIIRRYQQAELIAVKEFPVNLLIKLNTCRPLMHRHGRIVTLVPVALDALKSLVIRTPQSVTLAVA